jgi:hypothetical protein
MALAPASQNAYFNCADYVAYDNLLGSSDFSQVGAKNNLVSWLQNTENVPYSQLESCWGNWG